MTDAKQVEREPTANMVTAGSENRRIDDVWRAMWDAAPSPAAAPVGDFNLYTSPKPAPDYAGLCARLDDARDAWSHACFNPDGETNLDEGALRDCAYTYGDLFGKAAAAIEALQLEVTDTKEWLTCDAERENAWHRKLAAAEAERDKAQRQAESRKQHIHHLEQSRYHHNEEYGWLKHNMRGIKDERDTAIERAEKTEKDAERYRWLRDKCKDEDICSGFAWLGDSWSDTLDISIDKEIAKSAAIAACASK